jgi:hypothetical protein
VLLVLRRVVPRLFWVAIVAIPPPRPKGRMSR